MASKEPNLITTFLLLDQFSNYMQAVLERSPLTVKEYRYDLIFLFRFLKRDRKMVDADLDFHQIPLEDIDETFLNTVTTDDLFVFLIHLSRIKKASPAARARKTAAMKAFFKYLHQKRKLIDSNPAYELGTPKQPQRQPRYLSMDDSVALLQTSRSGPGNYNERDYCILTLFLNCGMRLSELTGIDLSSIHGDRLTVIGKGSKERSIYLNDACLEALDKWLSIRPKVGLKDPNALFVSRLGRRISNPTVQLLVKKWIAESGLDPARYSVHKLRHTAATLMYKYGKVDIRSLQAILGHASVGTTQIYTHIDDDDLRRAVAANPLAQISIAGKPELPDRIVEE